MLFTTAFTATQSSTRLAFFNGTAAPTAEAGLDDVVVLPAAAATVPEPASMMLLGTGLAGLVLKRRAQRAKSTKRPFC